MRFGLDVVVGGVLAVGLAGIAVGAVKTDFNHNLDFGKYHTYSWGTLSMPNPSAGGKVKHAVDVQLKAKGWKLVPSGGDTTVFATGRITSNQDTRDYYQSMGGGWGGVWGWNGWSWSQGYGGNAGPAGLGSVGTSPSTGSTTTHKKGNLEIDIFDTKTKDLLWRGLASGKTKDLQIELATMFVDFPPKPGQPVNPNERPPEPGQQ
jgi:Domain of unknown function (DUF4136)